MQVKAKQIIHSSLPLGRQVFSHPQEGRAPPHVTVTCEDKHHHSQHPHPVPLALCAECDAIWCGISLCSAGVLAVSPPGFLPIPSLLAGGVVWEAEKPLREQSSAIGIGVLPTLWSQSQNTALSKLLWSKEAQSQSKLHTAFYASVASLPLCATGKKSGNRKAPFIHVNLQSLCLEENLHPFIELFPAKLTHFSRQLLFFVLFKGEKVFSKNDSKSGRILFTILGTFLICTTPGYLIIENFYLALRNLQVSCYWKSTWHQMAMLCRKGLLGLQTLIYTWLAKGKKICWECEIEGEINQNKMIARIDLQREPHVKIKAPGLHCILVYRFS